MNEPRKTSASLTRKEIRRALLGGACNVLVLGRKFPVNDYTVNEALEHDFGMLWDDLLTVLTRLMKHLPEDKRRELREIILDDYNEDESEWLYLEPYLQELKVDTWKKTASSQTKGFRKKETS